MQYLEISVRVPHVCDHGMAAVDHRVVPRRVVLHDLGELHYHVCPQGSETIWYDLGEPLLAGEERGDLVWPKIRDLLSVRIEPPLLALKFGPLMEEAVGTAPMPLQLRTLR